MNRSMKLGAVAALLCAGTSAAHASDARSIAMGGAVIANGKGVHGAVSNPATLMQMNRRGETTHLRFGFSGEVRASSDLVDTLTDDENEEIFDDLDDEIDALNNQQITCNPITADDDTVCIADTNPLSIISNRFLDILNILDDETVDGRLQTDLGFALTHVSIPFSVNLSASATFAGTPDIADGDRDYISEFADVLQGDLEFGEIDDATFIRINETTGTVEVDLPDDDGILNSDAQLSAMGRGQLAISLAQTMSVAGYRVDLGVTPKFSSLQARDIATNISDEFDDSQDSFDDDFESSEVTKSTFTVDVGASMNIPTLPIQVAGVVRNLVPESITTNNGFEFETTPQLIVGAAFTTGKFNFTGDLALNSAKVDNFETQKMGVGVEFGNRLLAAKAGIAHDAARSDNATALTVGFTLGALEIGGRITDAEASEVSAQLAFSFK